MGLEEELAQARANLVQRDVELARVRLELEGAQKVATDASAAAAAAVAKYRESAVKELGAAAELVAGDTIEAVDAAVEKARALVGSIREQAGATSAAKPVPGAAAVRSGAPAAGSAVPSPAGGGSRSPIDAGPFQGVTAGELLRRGVARQRGEEYRVQ